MSDKLDFIYDSEAFVDLYSILDIDISTEKNEEIKSAYLKLVKIHHPDHGGNPEMFQQITKAYEILSNKELRKDYDLYYLKKSIDDIKGDDYSRLKSDFENFKNANTKPVSQEKLNEIYSDIFKDRDQFVEKKLEDRDISKKMNDINLERENMNIEVFDDKMSNFINEINSKSSTPINISDVFEYLKYKNKSQSSEIILGELGTLDTLPGYGTNYTSFVSESEYFGSNLYSEIDNGSAVFGINLNSNPNSDTNEISVDDFNSWKHVKKHDNKLSSDELELYLQRRRNEDNQIFVEVESNLNISAKKREVQKFLKSNYITDDIDQYYKSTNNSVNENNNLINTNTFNNIDDIDDIDDINDINDLNNLNNSKNVGNKKLSDENPLDFLEKIKNERLVDSNNIKPDIKNVRKREFK